MTTRTTFYRCRKCLRFHEDPKCQCGGKEFSQWYMGQFDAEYIRLRETMELVAAPLEINGPDHMADVTRVRRALKATSETVAGSPE